MTRRIDSSGDEVADECAYIYGDTSSFGGTSGSEYNQTINGTHYFIQEEFSNQEYALNPNSSCVQESLSQAVTFTSTAPSNPHIGDTYEVTATASSGQPVSLSIDAAPGRGCSISSSTSGSTVTFNTVGTCTIDANQEGNSNLHTGFPNPAGDDGDSGR